MSKESFKHETRNNLVITDAMMGMNLQDIAKKYGISRATVTRIVNESKEAKNLNTKVKEAFESMVEDAFNAVSEIVNNHSEKGISARLAAAQMILERTVGKVADKVESKNEHVITQDVVYETNLSQITNAKSDT